MKLLLFWGIICSACASCGHARDLGSTPPAPFIVRDSFPESYIGTWTGELEIFVPDKGRVQALPMELDVQVLTDSSYTYTIIYGEDREAGKRAYELVVRDPARGLYYIDERNTIGMEAYLVGGVFIQRFEVMNNLLETQTRIRPDGSLLWEIFSGPLDPVSSSGGKDFRGEDIPPVNTYPVKNYQRAVLLRD